MNRLKDLPINFFKCGVTGWCLEVVFTSLESVMVHDWRLIGRTSLLMFPIYGMGALLAPISSAVDRWIGQIRLRPADRIVRHGILDMVLIFTAEYLSGMWLRSQGNVSLGLYRKTIKHQRSNPVGFCSSVVSDRASV